MSLAVRQLVADLIAKGLDPVDAADFVARASVILAAAKGDAAAERRRAWDRERKAAERASAKSTGNPPDKAEQGDIYIINSNQLDKKDISPCPQNPVDKADKPFKYPAEFEEIWALFVRKVGKDAAFRKWKTAKTRVSHETLIAALKTQAAKDRKADPQFIPHPATWLHEGRWQDEELIPQEPRNVVAQGYWVAYGTEPGDAWERWFRSKGKIPPRDSRGGWHHPSEWPPDAQQSAA